MKVVTNMAPPRKRLVISNDQQRANDLNDFFLRFESPMNQLCTLDHIICNSGQRLEIAPNRVSSQFRGICSKKSMGPDGISAFLLKTCANELTPAFCPIFQKSIDSHIIPSLWKKSIIIPVPKKTCPVGNSDFRPVALTSNVMKCFERLVVTVLKDQVKSFLDPLQFAYKVGRGTDDAINCITHLVNSHLEDSQAYARLLFIDFSSAFNTLQPNILMKKLIELEVNPFCIKWFYSFLTNRTQQVRVNHFYSETKTTNIGAPQGCVSSPFLFSLYTNECVSSQDDTYFIKFSDDTAILSLLNKTTNPLQYFSDVDRFVSWCDTNSLVLNERKTVEMIFDPRSVGDHSPVKIHGNIIEQVSSYKYLGVYMDNLLCWSSHIDNLCSRLQQRLYFLRRLKMFGVNQRILFLFYQSVFESLIRYCITAWYGNLTVQFKSKLARLVHLAQKITGGEEKRTIQELYEASISRQAKRIVSDDTHILYKYFNLLPSGRRFRVLLCKSNRYKNSFVPTAIKILNRDFSI